MHEISVTHHHLGGANNASASLSEDATRSLVHDAFSDTGWVSLNPREAEFDCSCGECLRAPWLSRDVLAGRFRSHPAFRAFAQPPNAAEGIPSWEHNYAAAMPVRVTAASAPVNKLAPSSATSAPCSLTDKTNGGVREDAVPRPAKRRKLDVSPMYQLIPEVRTVWLEGLID